MISGFEFQCRKLAFFFVTCYQNWGLGLSIFEVTTSHTITQTHTHTQTEYDSSVREISSSEMPLPIQHTNKHNRRTSVPLGASLIAISTTESPQRVYLVDCKIWIRRYRNLLTGMWLSTEVSSINISSDYGQQFCVNMTRQWSLGGTHFVIKIKFRI